MKSVCLCFDIALFRWGQAYILDALMNFVPQDSTDAELLAERISVRLQHANSAVVLTTIKVMLYLMNYIPDAERIDALCRKLSPPLGRPSSYIVLGVS